MSDGVGKKKVPQQEPFLIRKRFFVVNFEHRWFCYTAVVKTSFFLDNAVA